MTAARFCQSCGTPRESDDRFCTSCGNAFDAAVAPAPVAAVAPVATKQPGRRGGPGRLVVLLVILGMLAGGATAGASYVYGDDFRFPRVGLPSWDDVQAEVPFLRPGGAARPIDEAELKRIDEDLGPLAARAEARQEQAIQQQLTALRIPVTTVRIVVARDGSRVLTVGVDDSKIASGAGLEGGFNALVSLVKAKQVDLAGLQHVTLIVHDRGGAGMYGIAAPTSAIAQFRDGKLDERGFVAAIGISVYNRLATVEAIRQRFAK